ncbi:type VI secretion system tip protein TssI/VgrG [Achromobacter piechaudii]|uniref:type VI secretion system tip protein TssI/VgrG n=1 Tax=Achromobacter piechaudii TaxID=72556 RepID=UPI00146868CB|nr:type VI secretion system tip protein TssI/VgrG [Achromobacter piechaudii]CAB3873414.1 hypothetical protein LMG2828_03089 [Achromobacter piechaudii]CAB3953844.1 hypothetical protein LMG6103_03993 [Achromobacter piechaudii]
MNALPSNASTYSSMNIATLSQQARMLRVSTPLDAELVAEQMTLREGVSRLFALTLDCLAASAELDVASLLGKEISVSLLQADGSMRRWHAVVEGVDALGADGGLARYRLHAAPWMAALALRRDSFIYQDKSVQDIVSEIFADYPQAAFAFELSEALPPLAACTQYRESDLQFVERILAEAGLCYRFEHQQDAGQAAAGGARHRVVIFDAGAARPEDPSSPLRFHRSDATETRDSITHFSASQAVRPNAVARAAWNERTLTAHAAQSRSQVQVEALPVLEDYDYAGHGRYADDDAAEQSAARSLRTHESRMVRFEGAGTARSLAPGRLFAMSQHERYAEGGGGQAVDELAGNRYVLLEVVHEATNNLGSQAAQVVSSADMERGTYRNRFTAQPEAAALMPAWHPRPTAPEGLAAVVVSAGDAPITSDRDLRVKVQFPWQRGDKPVSGGLPHKTHGDGSGNAPGDDRSGTWLRVAGAQAGPNWGAHHLPRGGTEVIVEFIDGDIDRPVIAGQLYNDADLPPWSAGEEAEANHAGVLSGWHSHGLDGAGRNQWVFDDTRGKLRTRLASSTAATQLGLGHLVEQDLDDANRGQWRGTGFELRSDAWTVVRSGQGMLVSATAREQAKSTQADAQEALLLLRGAQDASRRLNDSAGQHQARPMAAADGYDELLKALDAEQDGRYTAQVNGQAAGKAANGQRTDTAAVERINGPHLLIDTPNSLNLATPASAVLHAGEHLHATAQSDAHVAAQQTYSAVSARSASIFAQQGPLRAISAQAPVSLHAHTDILEALAGQDITVTSSAEGIEILGNQRVTLQAAGGSVTLDGADIVFKGPGLFSVKGATHNFVGPGSDAAQLPALPSTTVDDPLIVSAELVHKDGAMASAAKKAASSLMAGFGGAASAGGGLGEALPSSVASLGQTAAGAASKLSQLAGQANTLAGLAKNPMGALSAAPGLLGNTSPAMGGLLNTAKNTMGLVSQAKAIAANPMSALPAASGMLGSAAPGVGGMIDSAASAAGKVSQAAALIKDPTAALPAAADMLASVAPEGASSMISGAATFARAGAAQGNAAGVAGAASAGATPASATAANAMPSTTAASGVAPASADSPSSAADIAADASGGSTASAQNTASPGVAADASVADASAPSSAASPASPGTGNAATAAAQTGDGPQATQTVAAGSASGTPVASAATGAAPAVDSSASSPIATAAPASVAAPGGSEGEPAIASAGASSAAPTVAGAGASAAAPSMAGASASSVAGAGASSVAPTLASSGASAVAPSIAGASASSVAGAGASSVAPTIASAGASAVAPSIAGASASSVAGAGASSVAPTIASAGASAVAPSIAGAGAASIASASASSVTPSIASAGVSSFAPSMAGINTATATPSFAGDGAASISPAMATAGASSVMADGAAVGTSSLASSVAPTTSSFDAPSLASASDAVAAPVADFASNPFAAPAATVAISPTTAPDLTASTDSTALPGVPATATNTQATVAMGNVWENATPAQTSIAGDLATSAANISEAKTAMPADAARFASQTATLSGAGIGTIAALAGSRGSTQNAAVATSANDQPSGASHASSQATTGVSGMSTRAQDNPPSATTANSALVTSDVAPATSLDSANGNGLPAAIASTLGAATTLRARAEANGQAQNADTTEASLSYEGAPPATGTASASDAARNVDASLTSASTTSHFGHGETSAFVAAAATTASAAAVSATRHNGDATHPASSASDAGGEHFNVAGQTHAGTPSDAKTPASLSFAPAGAPIKRDAAPIGASSDGRDTQTQSALPDAALLASVAATAGALFASTANAASVTAQAASPASGADGALSGIGDLGHVDTQTSVTSADTGWVNTANGATPTSAPRVMQDDALTQLASTDANKGLATMTPLGATSDTNVLMASSAPLSSTVSDATPSMTPGLTAQTPGFVPSSQANLPQGVGVPGASGAGALDVPGTQPSVGVNAAAGAAGAGLGASSGSAASATTAAANTTPASTSAIAQPGGIATPASTGAGDATLAGATGHGAAPAASNAGVGSSAATADASSTGAVGGTANASAPAGSSAGATTGTAASAPAGSPTASGGAPSNAPASADASTNATANASSPTDGAAQAPASASGTGTASTNAPTNATAATSASTNASTNAKAATGASTNAPTSATAATSASTNAPSNATVATNASTNAPTNATSASPLGGNNAPISTASPATTPATGAAITTAPVAAAPSTPDSVLGSATARAAGMSETTPATSTTDLSAVGGAGASAAGASSGSGAVGIGAVAAGGGLATFAQQASAASTALSGASTFAAGGVSANVSAAIVPVMTQALNASGDRMAALSSAVDTLFTLPDVKQANIPSVAGAILSMPGLSSSSVPSVVGAILQSPTLATETLPKVAEVLMKIPGVADSPLPQIARDVLDSVGLGPVARTQGTNLPGGTPPASGSGRVVPGVSTYRARQDGARLQYVNLEQVAERWNDGSALTTTERQSNRPRIHVEFNRPGQHRFTITVKADPANLPYSARERGRRASYQEPHSNPRSYVTNADGKRIVDDIALPAAGLNLYLFEVRDERGQLIKTERVETVRRLYIQEVMCMSAHPAGHLADVTPVTAEFARHGIDMIQLPRLQFRGRSAVDAADSPESQQAIMNAVRGVYANSPGKQREPYTLVVCHVDRLAAPGVSGDMRLPVPAGPGGRVMTVPIVNDDRSQSSLWYEFDASDDWLVHARYLYRDASGAERSLSIPRHLITPIREANGSVWSVSVDLTRLSPTPLTGVLNIQFNTVADSYAGLAITGTNLLFVSTLDPYEPNSQAYLTETLAHEMGHLLGMVPSGPDWPGLRNQDDSADDSKLDPPPHFYYNAGGHCYYGLPNQNGQYNEEIGQCVMYGITCANIHFCPSCSKAVRKVDCSEGWTAF